jgi:hypothetical protein
MNVKYQIDRLRFFDPSTGKFGANFNDLASEISIVESIDFPGIRMTISVTDSIGMYTQIRGNELLEIVFSLPQLEQKKSYFLRVYKVGPIIRMEKRAKYNIECISQESMINETTNVHGSFKNQKVSEIVNKLLTDSKYIQIDSKSKKLYIEETKDKFQCVIPNWRVYDTINWMGGKAIRKNSKNSSRAQSGFIFYENYDGFHFKSFDQIIEEALNFTGYTDRSGNKIEHLKYRYSLKGQDSEQSDYGNIESITYPDVFDHVLPSRNGSYAGLYSSVSLDVISNTKLTTQKNTQAPYQSRKFTVTDQFQYQSHLGTISPYSDGNQVPPVYKVPRRNRVRPNQIHNWDAPAKEVKLDVGVVPQRAEETAIYTHCRKITFEAIKLQIRVLGNVTFHIGNPITVEIPRMLSDQGKIEMDNVYTGIYIIAGVRHKLDGEVIMTELVLVKDSLGSAKPKS